MSTETLQTIDPEQLGQVAGGATSNDQLTAMLTQISSSIKELASNKRQSDPSQLLLMMMMMGGFGGGGGAGGAVIAAPAAPAAPVINVDTSVRGGGYGRVLGGCFGGGCTSKKGW